MVRISNRQISDSYDYHGAFFSLLIIFYMTLLSEAVFFCFSFAIFLPTFTLPAFQIPLHNAF